MLSHYLPFLPVNNSRLAASGCVWIVLEKCCWVSKWFCGIKLSRATRDERQEIRKREREIKSKFCKIACWCRLQKVREKIHETLGAVFLFHSYTMHYSKLHRSTPETFWDFSQTPRWAMLTNQRLIGGVIASFVSYTSRLLFHSGNGFNFVKLALSDWFGFLQKASNFDRKMLVNIFWKLLNFNYL